MRLQKLVIRIKLFELRKSKLTTGFGVSCLGGGGGAAATGSAAFGVAAGASPVGLILNNCW